MVYQHSSKLFVSFSVFENMLKSVLQVVTFVNRAHFMLYTVNMHILRDSMEDHWFYFFLLLLLYFMLFISTYLNTFISRSFNLCKLNWKFISNEHYLCTYNSLKVFNINFQFLLHLLNARDMELIYLLTSLSLPNCH